jgi:hypothetical protein
MIADAASDLASLAKWPDSESTRDDATKTVKALRKAFREDAYPLAFLYLAMCHIAHDMYGNAVDRAAKPEGLRAAWMKLGELLD